MINLNKVQRTAAEINSKHALIRAGPGTGKTTAIINGQRRHFVTSQATITLFNNAVVARPHPQLVYVYR